MGESIAKARNQVSWRALRLLRKDSCHDHGRVVNAVDDAPTEVRIRHSKFMTTTPDYRHRTGVGHSKCLSPLQEPEKEPNLASREC